MEEIIKSIVEFTNINLGNPWFCLVDVCNILDIDNPRRANLAPVITNDGVSLTTNQFRTKALYDHVDEEDKTTLLIQQSGSNKTTIINESNSKRYYEKTCYS